MRAATAEDVSLTKHRMDARWLMYKFNVSASDLGSGNVSRRLEPPPPPLPPPVSPTQHFEPPLYQAGDPVPAQFGPDARFELLQRLFGLPDGPAGLEQAKRLVIEPPLYVDYGTNINFKGAVSAPFGA